jgi:diguanylate cyclase
LNWGLPAVALSMAGVGAAVMVLLLWLLGGSATVVAGGALGVGAGVGLLVAAGMRMLQDLESVRLRQKERASRDGTTGVDTRQRFMALAKREMARCTRYGHPMSMLWLEVDHFEALRNTHGEVQAERALRTVVRCVRDTVRVPDMVGRMSGPTLAVLLPQTDPLGALDVAERIRLRIDTASPRLGQRMFKLSVSVGTAALDKRYTALGLLLADVKAALRQAQQAGGNVVRTAAFRSHPKDGGTAWSEGPPSVPGYLQLPPGNGDSPQNSQKSQNSHRRSGEA